MLRGASSSIRPHVRHIRNHTSNASSLKYRNGLHRVALVSSVALTSATFLWYQSRTIRNDVDVPAKEVREGSKERKSKATSPAIEIVEPESETLHGLVWGSNEFHTVTSEDPSSDALRTPLVAKWLENVALRDFQLHQKHAACVDARGDVYQWGDGYFGDAPSSHAQNPRLTLTGKNIVKLQLTESRVYALSASGKVYALASEASQQLLGPGRPTPASSPWWSTGWLWGEAEQMDFVEVVPTSRLAWRESYVFWHSLNSIISITAGQSHLLALTSKGRVFAHPVNLKANVYGQLGFRNLDIPNPSHSHALENSPSRVPLELVPKSLANTRSLSASNNSDNIDDRSIRFCPSFFEIPALKGVEIVQIAAGGQTSFARTTSGRVLGWGANQFGQIGLGGNSIMDTIIVPTEVVLWQAAPRATTKCLDVTAGGDLTAFTVEREPRDAGSKTIDLLICGNGQWGGLGNNLYSNAQGSPLRVKGASGLEEFDDHTKSLQPIVPQRIAISPTGHILLTLDTSRGGVEGRDLLAWGKNYDSELGNGKRSSSAVPINLSTPSGERLMLCQRKAKEVKDLKGKVWKRGVKVEQRAVVGYGNSVVYWQIYNP
ncbi:RCC1/BLIP-II [Pluteus cervinus]|uniref:RCC1/BLIP-II n=1 Tax=Pluteus cervinus TaxID=181527 RepID=A0ACD3B2L5_9AGAR|nr:RCC1/BLIP-II [Pluteus cervinus]